MIKQQDTFEQLARFRQSMYRVFAAAFLPPGPERFVNLITDMPLESAELGYLATYQKWCTWRKALLHIDDAVESDVEYLRVFSAGMSGAVKPPLGHSYNIDPVRGDVGETLLDLARLYDEIRLEPTGAMSDALDHVSRDHVGVVRARGSRQGRRKRPTPRGDPEQPGGVPRSAPRYLAAAVRQPDHTHGLDTVLHRAWAGGCVLRPPRRGHRPVPR